MIFDTAIQLVLFPVSMEKLKDNYKIKINNDKEKSNASCISSVGEVDLVNGCNYQRMH